MRAGIATIFYVVVFIASGHSIVWAESPQSTAPCPVTPVVRDEPPDDPHADPFGSGPWYINEDRTIWAGWDATRMEAGSNKVLWIRPQGAELKVSGRRIDRESGPVVVRVPCCYVTGFQASSLTFPEP